MSDKPVSCNEQPVSSYEPVYQAQAKEGWGWHDYSEQEYKPMVGFVFSTRILYLAAAYEALQKENAELKEAAKYSEHIDATPANQRETMLYDTLVERDALLEENEQIKSDCAKLLSEQDYQYNKRTNELITRHAIQIRMLEQQNLALIKQLAAVDLITPRIYTIELPEGSTLYDREDKNEF